MTGDVAPGYFLRRPGGAMSTASALVFQGHIDGHFRVFDGRTGAQLRDINVGTSIMAAPMTYRIAGQQYVSVMAGVGSAFDGYADKKYGSMGRIVTFKLGGGDVPLRPLLTLTADSGAGERAAARRRHARTDCERSSALYERNCALCHASGRAPDLTRMSKATHDEFLDILLKGTRTARAMPSFEKVLSQADVQAIHAFVINVAATSAKQTPSQQQAAAAAAGPANDRELRGIRGAEQADAAQHRRRGRIRFVGGIHAAEGREPRHRRSGSNEGEVRRQGGSADRSAGPGRSHRSGRTRYVLIAATGCHAGRVAVRRRRRNCSRRESAYPARSRKTTRLVPSTPSTRTGRWVGL